MPAKPSAFRAVLKPGTPFPKALPLSFEEIELSGFFYAED